MTSQRKHASHWKSVFNHWNCCLKSRKSMVKITDFTWNRHIIFSSGITVKPQSVCHTEASCWVEIHNKDVNRVCVIKESVCSISIGFVVKPHPRAVRLWVPGLIQGLFVLMEQSCGIGKRRITLLIGQERIIHFPAKFRPPQFRIQNKSTTITIVLGWDRGCSWVYKCRWRSHYFWFCHRPLRPRSKMPPWTHSLFLTLTIGLAPWTKHPMLDSRGV